MTEIQRGSDHFEEAAGVDPVEAPTGPVSGSLDIGTRVGAVFTAAERAGQDIMRMAREEADDLRLRARADAEALLERGRSQGEERARAIVARAQADARTIRARAEKDARELETAARKRVERIEENITLLAERVEWTREGLREAVARLDDVLPSRRPAARTGGAGATVMEQEATPFADLRETEAEPSAGPDGGFEPEGDAVESPGGLRERVPALARLKPSPRP